MDDAMENEELIWLTHEYVMDPKRRECFAAMIAAMPDEELLKFPRMADIRQENRQKNRQKGRQEGEAKFLIRQLTRRFGELPAAVHEQIAIADSDALERWGDLVLDARSLKDVFGPNLPEVH